MDNQLPRGILFDMDDTVVDTESASERAWQEVGEELARAVGGQLEPLLAALMAADQWYWEEPERALAGRLDQAGARAVIVRRALAALGHDQAGSATTTAGAGDAAAGSVAAANLPERLGRLFAEARVRHLQPFPGALDALRELRARGVALALVTNGEAEQQRAKMNRVALPPYFDAVVVEGELGVGKPDPRVFQHALQAIGVGARNAWVVGDNLEWEIGGAQRLGMHAVWVDSRRRGLPAAPPAVPDRIVHNITELLG